MLFLDLLPSLRALVASGLLLTAGAAAAEPASTSASEWARTEFADVRLVSAVAGTEGRSDVPMGLEFRLAEGWKVYWRSAGDAGYPPQVDWAGSSNLAEAAISYPVPHRFSLFGLEQYGYSDHVVYPVTARLAEPGKPIAVRAAVNALACSDICVPLEASLRLDLPATPPKPTAFTQLLDRWTARVPADLPGLGLDVTEARAVGDPASPTLVVRLESADPLGDPDVFPEGPAGLSFGKPEVALRDGGRAAEFKIPVGVQGDSGLAGTALTLTVVDGDRFVERRVTVNEGRGVAQAAALSWPAVLGAALLGGLILNLMPCVLPVLSLKLLSAVGYGGAARGAIRRGFLASAAGIIVSFLVLAGGAVALKEAGVAVGWGMQFQQPLFLAAMAALVTLFAANLAGLLEVPLPRALADLGARLPSESGSGGGSLAGHFLTGAFATLLATPCSAPFLGTAVGFALTGGPTEIVAVFAAMGLGLALPYLLVAAVPGLARALPKPGRWMMVLRQILAVALAATAIWLLTVLAAQIGTMAAVAAGIVLAALAIALAILRRFGLRLGLPAGIAATALVLVLAGTADRPSPRPGMDQGTAGAVTWRSFDQAEIARLTADRQVVLVDVTADWCLTCKVNKAAVLDRGPVAELLADGRVSAMRADWTNPDPTIADYLASFGRYGIPFNAVYGPNAPNGIALPELLTEAAVLSAVRQAGADRATARLD